MANAERPTQPETQAQPKAKPPVRVARFRGTLNAPLGTTVTTEVTQPASETLRNVGNGVLAGVVQYFFHGKRLQRPVDVAVTAQATMDLPLGFTAQASLDLSQADVARAQRIAIARAQQTVEEARLCEPNLSYKGVVAGTARARHIAIARARQARLPQPTLGVAYDRVAARTETHVAITITTLWGWLGAQRGTNARLSHNMVEGATIDITRRETIRQLTAAGNAVTATVTAIRQAITHPQLPSREEGIQLACRFC